MSTSDLNETTGNAAPPSFRRVLVVVMGVSGTGKSTLGAELANALDMPFVDGDDLHPKSNIEKMSSGQSLSDADRKPWLELIRTTAERMTAEKQTDSHKKMSGIVVGCSALKKCYRDILRGVTTKDHQSPKCMESVHPNILSTYFIFIDGPRETLIERMEKRTDHFMKPSMLDSQLQTLETPVGEEGVMVVSLNDTTDTQVTQALDGLSRRPEFDTIERHKKFCGY